MNLRLASISNEDKQDTKDEKFMLVINSDRNAWVHIICPNYKNIKNKQTF